jgi:nucleoside-diphosphate-sugar epimerase
MDTVLVTGGSGRIGSEIVRHLNDHGYRTVSVDVVPGPDEADEFIEADVTDAGEVYGALARADPDGVAHMGAIPNAGRHPDHVVFESNAMGAYHVLDAASALDVEAICMASSIQAMGTVPPIEVEYLPVDEAHPLAPMDPYELGKQTVETLADGFARRSNAPGTISTFRFPLVIEDDEIRARFPEGDGTVESLAEESRNHIYAYATVGDVAALARCALEADFEGHERFWVSAADNRTTVKSRDIAERFYPDAEVRGDLSGYDPLIDTSKARDLLGWEPETSWRDL